ncbi:aldehyde dehydrogenase family protein, partial [Pseudomonas sp. GW460-13]
VEDPNTGLVSAQILPGTEEDVGLALGAAQNALASWSATSVSDKCAILNRLKDQLTNRQESLADAIAAEVGTPLKISRIV